MAREISSAVAAVAAADWLRAVSVAGIATIIIFAVLVAIGFAVLFARRRGTVDRADDPHVLARRANILLVRVDDAVKSSEDELGFAVAQFGQEKTREFAAAIGTAKQQLAEAFSLQQRLDDATPNSATQQRDWSATIIHLCEAAQATLSAQQERFDRLRQLEQNAPANLRMVRERIAAETARLPSAEATTAKLRSNYDPPAIAGVDDNLRQARDLLIRAGHSADAAQAGLADDHGVAGDDIREAEDSVQRAGQLLDAIDTIASTLGTAAEAVATLVDTTRAGEAEARSLRDAPPDAHAAARVNGALTMVDGVLSELTRPRKHSNPMVDLNRLRDANAALDTALGDARSQQRRLNAAREALAGALVIAHSQIATTADFIDTRRGAIGSEARTRLAEARRQLQLAEAEADPVTALDTARRSATFSRDADALARYDVMNRSVR